LDRLHIFDALKALGAYLPGFHRRVIDGLLLGLGQ
jgi:hypothetical protein